MKKASTMRQGPLFFRLTWAGMVLCVVCTGPSGWAQTNPPITPTTVPTPAPVPALQPAGDGAELAPLLKQVDEAIDVNSRRFLVANSHSPWQIFHGILALRQNFQLKLGDQKVSALDWIATSEPKFDNEPLIIITEQTPDGNVVGANFHPFSRPYAFQGHPGQFLALLTPCNLPTDFKFKCNGKEVTIAHMLRDVMLNVNAQEEVTWVLWSLNHYLKIDSKWNNKFGQPWSLEQLVQVENNAVVENAACGGNHGLFAISRARDKYVKTGQPLRGTWLQADYKIQRYTEIARTLQNQDGTFSASFYKGPEFSTDINSRLNSTGHTMEFLAASLPEARLREPWVQNAVQILSKDLIEHRHDPVECGPLYHSLNALIIYRDRIRKNNAPAVVLKPNIEPTIQPRLTPALLAPMPSSAGLRPIHEAPISAMEPANRR